MTILQEARSAFRNSVKLGTGRAYLVAQSHPEVDFSAYIIEAALKNFAYDGQAEPSRAAYLYELYCLVPQQARIRRAVLRALATERNDTWTLTQLFKLTLFFAQQGDVAARKALYQRFLRNPISGSDWAGAHELITLGGLAGLQHIARKYGQLLAKSPERWQDDSLITFFEERYPAVDAWASLRQLATHDENVRRYLHTIAATEARRDTQHLTRQQSGAYETPSLASLIERPHSAYVRRALKRREVELADLKQLAELLLTERNTALQENLLYLFSLVKFPLSYAPILALARGKSGSRARIVAYAIDALALLPAPEIRSFALQKLATTTMPARYTSLLRSNYQAGDAALLTSIVKCFHNEHTIEMLADSYTTIYEANPTPECAGPLLALYAKMNCGMHRYEVVKLLLANDVLPAWLNAELPFDSYPKTRLLYQPPA